MRRKNRENTQKISAENTYAIAENTYAIAENTLRLITTIYTVT